MHFKKLYATFSVSLLLSACASGPTYETEIDLSKAGFIRKTNEKHQLLSVQSIDGKNLDFGTKINSEALPISDGTHSLGLRAWFNHHWLVGKSCSVPATRELNDDKKIPCGIYSLTFVVPTKINAKMNYQLILSNLHDDAKFDAMLKDTLGKVIWEKKGLTAIRQEDEPFIPYTPIRVK